MDQKSVSNGFLVAFDGIDGAGKSTQLRLANESLVKAGWPVQTTRNLGGTPIGEELRKVMKAGLARPAATNLYISAAIQEALIEEVGKLRASNGIILMDRSPLSLAAYEIYGSGLDEALGRPLVDRGMAALAPDLLIIYTADITLALQRARASSPTPDYFESKPPDYFERVAAGYKEAGRRYEKVVYVDGNQPVDAAHAQTMQLIEAELAIRA